MRPLEVLSLVAGASAISSWAVPRFVKVRWSDFATPLAVLVMTIQIIVEGPRWQMDPAYVLIGLLFAVWLLKNLKPFANICGRILTHRITGGLLVGLGVLGLTVSAGLGTILPVFHFPQPTGHYGIGTVTYHWVDTNRHEVYSTDPTASRELMAQVWYPAIATFSTARAPYVTDADALSASLARQLHLPPFTFDYWKHVTTNAVTLAPVAPDKSTYPVLIFLSGVDGFRQSNTFQIEELTSHGYVVVGLDQPYAAAAVTFPNGRVVTGSRDFLQPFINQSLGPPATPRSVDYNLPNGVIPYLAQDVTFTLNQLAVLNLGDPNGILTGRLNLRKVGIFGTSLGATVTGEACHTDPRLGACLMMDAAMVPTVVQSGLRQPSMWLTRDKATMRLERWKESDISQALDTMHATFAKSESGQGYYVEVPGMFHINFTDAPYYSPLASMIGLTGPIDGQRGLHIVNAYTLAFFDRYLDAQSEPLLDGPSKQFPEAKLSIS